MNNIQIGIITYSQYRNNEKIINLIIYLLHKLAKYPENLEFFIISHCKKNLNLNIIKNFINLYKIKAKYFDLGDKILSHSETLEIMLKEYNGDYGFFCDSDLICFYKNWDENFIKSLSNNTIAIGNSYHKDEKKYLNFPNIMGFFFKIKEFLIMCNKILKKKNSSIFCLNPDYNITFKYKNNKCIGYINRKKEFIRIEIGFLLPIYFEDYDHKGITLDTYRLNENEKNKLKFCCNNLYNLIKKNERYYIRKGIRLSLNRRLFEEFHYNNNLVFVHIGMGSTIKYDLFYKTEIFELFLKKICEYFKDSEIRENIYKIFNYNRQQSII